MKKFKFELKAAVTIIASGVIGNIIGRSDNVNCSDQFLVAHKNEASGKSIQEWVYANEIKAAPVKKPVAKKTPVKHAVKKAAKKAPAKRAVKKSNIPVPSVK